MNIARSRFLVVASLCAVLVGCPAMPGGEGEGEGEGDCTGAFDIEVSEGLTPTFTWDGDAAGLAVALASDGSVRQWVLGMAATPFSSPVTYGEVPSGALEAQGAAEDLVAGTEYTITITAGNGADASCQAFTPADVGGDAG